MQGAEFLSVMEQMVSPQQLETLCQQYAPRPRTQRKVSSEALISSLIFHQLQPAGTLAKHGARLHGIKMSDSAYSQRRQLLPVELFDQIMQTALQPLANEARQPESFYEGYRLVGVDGTQWSVSNTPCIVAALPKAASRRLSAAFAKLRLVSIVELGTHAPLAALAGPARQSEQALANALWPRVPDKSLLIADRLFGTPYPLWQALRGWDGRDVRVLVRVRDNLKAQLVKRLADGSALVQVDVREAGRKVDQLLLREIRAQGASVSGKRFTLRLWTTLLDAQRYAAKTLARQYAERWEHELYYRELKLDVRNADILASHTVDNALQEVAALVLASAIIARLRVSAADQLKQSASRVSFFKLMLATQQLWSTLQFVGTTLTAAQRVQIWEKYIEEVRDTALLPHRRERSCPRVLRQPVSSWPRKTDQPSFEGHTQIEVVHI